MIWKHSVHTESIGAGKCRHERLLHSLTLQPPYWNIRNFQLYNSISDLIKTDTTGKETVKAPHVKYICEQALMRRACSQMQPQDACYGVLSFIPTFTRYVTFPLVSLMLPDLAYTCETIVMKTLGG